MKPKILLNSGSLYSYGLNRFFELAKKAGYDGIELIIDNNWDNRQPEYVKKLEKQYKIRVLSVHSAMEFVTCWGKDPKIRYKKSIEIAKAVGAKLIVIHPHDFTDRKFFAWIKRNYQEIIDLAKPVRVAFENHTSRRNLNEKKYFTFFPSYTLDTSHVATTQRDLLEVSDEVKDKLDHIHLSDSDFARRKNLPNLIDDRHMIPGTGKLPLKEFLQKLKEIKYSGYIVTELLPETVGAGQSDEIVLKNLKKALSFVKKSLD